MQTKKALVNVLRATNVFQMSQTGSGDLGLRRADPVVLKGSRFLSAFVDVTAKKAAASREWSNYNPSRYANDGTFLEKLYSIEFPPEQS
jgi:hypothetical protein